MEKILRRVEWVLLVVIGGLALFLGLSSIDPFGHHAELKEAKKKGYYYKVDADKQTYFNREVNIEGVVYGEGKLVVYVSSRRLLSLPKLPNSIQLKTDDNEVFENNSAAKHTRIYRSYGRFTFSNVPPDMKSVTLFKEAYGESFSFHIPLEGRKID